jgi:hypothetical protein
MGRARQHSRVGQLSLDHILFVEENSLARVDVKALEVQGGVVFGMCIDPERQVHWQTRIS